MKLLNIFKKKTITGLDLGNNWTKVVRVQPKGKTLTLERIGRRAWTREDKKKQETLSGGLQQMFRDLEIRDRNVIASLAGHSVIIKQFDAKIAEKEKKARIDINRLATQQIPFDIKDVFLDYHFAGPGAEENTRKVLLVASKKSMVLELQKTIANAGLSTLIVDVDGFALTNCFEYNYPEHHPGSTYLLDIGAVQSIFCVHSGNYPSFIRDAGFGGQHITNRLAALLDIKHKEAESLKMNGADHLELKAKRKISPELEDIYSSWAEEIQRLIHFYRNTKGSDHSVSTLFLSGGGSISQGLRESLAFHLGLEVQYMDPWRRISLDESRFDPAYLQSCGPQYCVAAGLALRSVL
ncbi:MAG: pilus assembly protein PilM [Desulfohalobiaceae bacterium]|nr:pilus assembly protein PilM [Desulfohalobiaceae bacterium]